MHCSFALILLVTYPIHYGLTSTCVKSCGWGILRLILLLYSCWKYCTRTVQLIFCYIYTPYLRYNLYIYPENLNMGHPQTYSLESKLYSFYLRFTYSYSPPTSWRVLLCPNITTWEIILSYLKILDLNNVFLL